MNYGDYSIWMIRIGISRKKHGLKKVDKMVINGRIGFAVKRVSRSGGIGRRARFRA
jgi:hypothetical protein